MAREYVKAPNYPEAARRVIKKMHEQVGDLVVDEHGLAMRGVLLRHLVMPGGIAGTREIMQWVAREMGPETYVNVMAQYYPVGKVSSREYVQINRRITSGEFHSAVDEARAAGLRRLDGRSGARL
jgi:putative pyruvate formate lyase activating enzyme